MDFQLPIQDLFEAYKREIATLSSRAIMAEAGQAELTKQLEQAHADLAAKEEELHNAWAEHQDLINATPEK